MLFRVRRIAFLVCLAVAAVSARADWLIFVPSGRKLTHKHGRAEIQWAAETARDFRTKLGYGLTTSFEVDLTSETIGTRNTLTSLDLSYTFTDPVTNFIPGLQIGVVDAVNATEEGRRFFAAVSYDIGMTGEYNNDTPMKLTLGAFGGSMNGPFVGVSIPFAESFIALAEHDSRKLTAGFEFKPTRVTSFKWLFQDNRVLWAAGFNFRF